MKKFIYLTTIIAMVIMVSCTDDNPVANETDSEFKNYLKSSDYKNLEISFPTLVKNINSESFIEFEENGIKLFSFQSIIGSKILGNIVFYKTKKGDYITIIEKNNFDNNGNIPTVDYKTVLGENLFSFYRKTIDEDTFSLKLNKKSLEDGYTKRSWWTCTRECVGDAWGACAGDGECDFVCTVSGPACPAAIAASCAGWCAQDTDNDLTP